jgi:mannose-1-phosphate guanylyltransferase
VIFEKLAGRARSAVREQPLVASKRCCIIVANDKHAERFSPSSPPRASGSAAAVAMGFLRLAARRARKLSSPANVIVSAREGDRQIWESPLWFTRPENRFISEPGTPTSLATAAAVLSIAAKDPSCPIAILPSDFWVARESVLTEAIENALGQLPVMPDSVATLGMIDYRPGGQEDYLVVGPRDAEKGAVIQARINRPESRLAKQLMSEGAMVASGILLGYAQAFAARIIKYWPHLAKELSNTLRRDYSPDIEHRFSAFAYRQIPHLDMHSVQLSPPTFPARAFPVRGSGWCSRQFAGS